MAATTKTTMLKNSPQHPQLRNQGYPTICPARRRRESADLRQGVAAALAA